MTVKTRVSTDAAPAPAHTFSQGVRKGPFVQVSGQGPVDPVTGEYLHPGDVAAQTTRTLENVKAIVEASGATFDDVVMLRVYLTAREFQLLRYLIERAGKTVPRNELLRSVWGYDSDTLTRTVDTHVASLRQKLEKNPKQPEFIFTVSGVGYKFIGQDSK